NATLEAGVNFARDLGELRLRLLRPSLYPFEHLFEDFRRHKVSIPYRSIPPGETPAAFPPEPTRMRERAGSAGQGRPTSAARIAGCLEGRALRRATLGSFHSGRNCHALDACPGATRRALHLRAYALFMGHKARRTPLSPRSPSSGRSHF